MADRGIVPFLMFSGQAAEAMGYYVSIFARSVRRYGPNAAGPEAKVFQASFSLQGQIFRCTDSRVQQDFTFTPAISFFVTLDSEHEAEEAFTKPARDGVVLLPLGSYPFSSKFGWVQDRFGISRQLTVGAV
jgi:predicted 3-demethylubiquinone-9 3-methyltransferase (glyoxalase superfamily)